MIFKQLFQEPVTIAILEPELAERRWLLNRLELRKAVVEEYDGVERLLDHPDPVKVDVLLLSLSGSTRNPASLVSRVREKFSRTAIVLMDDFDDGRLSKLASELNCQDVLLKAEISPGTLTRSVLFSLQRFRNQMESERLRLKAEELAKAKESFASMVSHEILNPMAGILGYLELLQRTELDSQQRSYTQTVLSSVSSLGVLVKDLLSFAKLEQGVVAAHRQAFSPYGLMLDLEKQLAGQNQKPEVRVLTHCDPNLPSMLVGDRVKIRQVAFNLAQNALKFTDSGHVAVYLRRLGDHSGGHGVRLIVEDSGRGIPADKFESILEPFSQAREEDGACGHGLGLAIVGKLLGVLNSKLNLQSKIGKGTVFWADFRLENDVSGTALDRPLEGRRVVVLDESPLARSLLKETVVGLGGEVLDLYSPNWSSCRPDLILAHQRLGNLEELLAQSRGRVPRRFIYGCEFEKQGPDSTYYLEGTCPAHRLVELLRAPAKIEKRAPEVKCQGAALVVDDDEVCRNYLLQELEALGLATDSAGNCEHAMTLARSRKYDLVALDGYIGDSTGPSLYRRLRREGLISDDTLVLIVTGDPESWRNRVRETDSSIHIVGKPLNAGDLTRILDKGLTGVKIDPARLGKLMRLGEAAVRKLYDVFFENLTVMMSSIDQAILAGDSERVKAAAHKLKGSASTVGLVELEKLAGSLELSAANPQNWGDYRTSLSRAVSNLDINTILRQGGAHEAHRTDIALSS